MAKKIVDENGKVYIQKKPIYKRVWFIILAVIVAVAIINSLTGKKTDNTTSTSNNTQTTANTDKKEEVKKEKPKEVIHKLGEDVVVGDMLYKVNPISTTDRVGNEFLGENAKGIYVLVPVEVKNNGKKETHVTSSYFKLKSGDVEYEASSSGTLYANNNENGASTGLLFEPLNPGLTMNGVLVFDVPQDVANAENLTLQVQTGAFGTEKADIKLK